MLQLRLVVGLQLRIRGAHGAGGKRHGWKHAPGAGAGGRSGRSARLCGTEVPTACRRELPNRRGGHAPWDGTCGRGAATQLFAPEVAPQRAKNKGLGICEAVAAAPHRLGDCPAMAATGNGKNRITVKGGNIPLPKYV